MNGFLAKLAELTWSRVLIGSLLAGVVYYLFMFDTGDGLTQQYESTKSQLQQAQDLLVQTEKAVAHANKFEEEVMNQEAQFQEMVEYLPPQMNVGELMQALSREAATAGTQILKIEPKGKSEKTEFYEATKIDLKLQGSYAQVSLFLSYLSRIPRLLTFDRIALELDDKSEPESPRVNFTGTLVGYRYVSEAEANPDAAAAAAGGENGKNPNAAN